MKHLMAALLCAGWASPYCQVEVAGLGTMVVEVAHAKEVKRC